MKTIMDHLKRRKSELRPTGPVDRATTLVKTNALNSKGIDHIRVLSESKFVGLVREMVEDSLRQHMKDGTTTSASGPPGEIAARVEDEYQRKWEELRKKHESKLHRIESGMRRLSSAFDGIKVALGRMNSPQATASETELVAEPARNHQRLLRDMLL